MSTRRKIAPKKETEQMSLLRVILLKINWTKTIATLTPVMIACIAVFQVWLGTKAKESETKQAQAYDWRKRSDSARAADKVEMKRYIDSINTDSKTHINSLFNQLITK